MSRMGRREARGRRGLLALAIWLALALAGGAQAAGAAEYVALGDSFTAGPLIPVQEAPYGCLKSTKNYPHQAARRLGLTLSDPSCSGADTGDMTQPQGVTPGPNPPQFDALTPDTEVVTLQIGGNDIGFTSIAEDCFSATPTGTPCQDRYVVNGQDEISARIAATAPKVAAVLAGIRERSPNARVFVVNYAAILPDSGPGCWPTLPITNADVPYVRAKQKELNAMLAEQAAAAGATLVDWYTASIGHDSCKPPLVRWVEPLVPLNAAAPIHPNLFGMVGAANLVVAAVGSG